MILNIETTNQVKNKEDIMLERAENNFWAYEAENKNISKDLSLLDNVQFTQIILLTFLCRLTMVYYILLKLSDHI